MQNVRPSENQNATGTYSMKILTPDQEQTITRLFEYDHTFLVGKMGSGKTVCAMTAAQELLKAGELHRILIIAPLRVCNTVWTKECGQWEHLTFDVNAATGTAADRTAAMKGRAQFVAINYELLQWFCASEYIESFDGLIIDDISRFRKPGGQEFKALRKIIKHFTWRVGMTGTPVSENWEGLYAQMLLVDGGERLGKSKARYMQDYFYSTDYEQHTWALRDDSEKRITEKIKDVVWVMEDYTNDLPIMTVKEHYVTLPEKAREAYTTMAKEMVLGDIEAVNMAVLSGKLQQIASGFIYDEDGDAARIHARKWDAVLNLVVAADGPVIIVYQFEWELKHLRKVFPGAPVAREEKSINSTMIEDWNAGKTPVLLMHPRSGGHGLNLQYGGHTIIWWGPLWSREAFDQVNARLWRRGQRHPVSVHIVIAVDTVDGLVMDRLDAKGGNHGDFIAHIDSWASCAAA